MSQRTVAVASRVGLHARPAGLFTQAVSASGIPVTIAKVGGAPVDASSILSVLALGAQHGEMVELIADGPDADRVLDELSALLCTDLDEPDTV